MQKGLDDADYGNKLTGAKIDNFWLEGDLRISAKEQIKFLKKLINNKLPYKQENQEIVKEILITDSTENYIIRSKTGWAMRVNTQIGWLVGYVEKEHNKWIFAMNINIVERNDAKFRKKITYEILKKETIIE